MKTDVFELLKRASVFMILAQAVIHFSPSPVYEKYIRFLAGIMTVVILFLPLMEQLRRGVADEYWDSLAEYRQQVEKTSRENFSMRDISNNAYVQAAEEEIKETLNRSLTGEEVSVSRVELIGTMDGTGKEATIKIVVRKRAEQDNTDNKITVDTISVSGWEEEEEGRENVRLREKMAEILQTDSSNLKVVIADGIS